MATAEVDGARSSERAFHMGLNDEKVEDTENVLDDHCQPCLTEGETVNSSKFCVDCNEFLCNDCIRTHRKFSCSRHHRIVDNRDDMSNSSKTTSAGTCFYHFNKFLDQFCEQHDEFCCVLCLSTRHRACTAKSTIYEVSAKLSEKEINDIEGKVVKAVEKLREVKITRSRSVDLLVSQRQDTLNTLESIKNDLQTVFEEVHQRHTETVEKKCVKLRKELENDIQTCDEMEENLKKGELSLKSEDKIKQFIHIKQLSKQLVIVEATTDAMVNDVPEKILELKRTPLCSNILNQPELLIQFSEDKRFYKATGEANTVYVKNLNPVKNLIPLAFERIYDCSCLYQEPSKLIFTERSSILIHDTMRKQTKERSFPKKISTMAVEKNTFFIALQEQGLVVTPGEDDKMTIILKTGEPCVGIIKTSNMFYITVKSKKTGQLREYTVNGNLNNVLKTNDKGENIFTDGIGEVKISKQEDKLYVVDTKIGIVIASALTFKLLKTISLCNSPKGISLVKDMSLFVLFENGEVNQTTDEGETWNVVLKSVPETERYGVGKNTSQTYHSICWDGYSSMFVTCSSEKHVKVLQYQLEFCYM